MHQLGYRPDWMDRGACYGMTSMFFSFSEETEQACKRVCFGCDVRVPCLEYALLNAIDEGVWGGATEKERRRIRRGRKQSS